MSMHDIPIEESNNVNDWRCGECLSDLHEDIGRELLPHEIFELAEEGNRHAINVLRAALDTPEWAHDTFYPKFDEGRARRVVEKAQKKHEHIKMRWRMIHGIRT